MGCLRRIAWKKYPLRMRLKYNVTPMPMYGFAWDCRVCGNEIVVGHEYYDGGRGLRAHRLCAERECAARIEKARAGERR